MIAEKIKNICYKIAKAKSTNNKDFVELLKLLPAVNSDMDFEGFIPENNSEQIVPVIRKRWNAFEENLEKKFAKKFLSNSEVKIDDFPFWRRYNEMIKSELALSQIKINDKILVIGSGPFPISAILLYYEKKCKITCLEKRKENVGISRHVISKLMLENYITVLFGNGAEYNLSEYDFILISSLAIPKRNIFRNVLTTANPQCRILARTVYGINKILYEPIEHCIDGFDILNQYNSSNKVVNSAILLKKA